MEYFLVIYQLICGQLSPFSYEGFKGQITFEIVHASFSKPLYQTVANSFSSVLQSCWDQSDSTVATYICLIKTCIRMVTPPQPQPNLIHLEIKVHSTGNKKRMHASYQFCNSLARTVILINSIEIIQSFSLLGLRICKTHISITRLGSNVFSLRQILNKLALKDQQIC